VLGIIAIFDIIFTIICASSFLVALIWSYGSGMLTGSFTV